MLKRPSLVGVFQKVAQVPAFRRELLLGNIRSLYCSECGEEIAHCLLYACSVWTKILDVGTVTARRVDSHTIERSANDVTVIVPSTHSYLWISPLHWDD